MGFLAQHLHWEFYREYFSLELGHTIKYTNSLVSTHKCTNLKLDNGLLLTDYSFTFVQPLCHMCLLDSTKSTTIESYCSCLKEVTSISLLCLVKLPNLNMCPTIGLVLICHCDFFWVWLCASMCLCGFKYKIKSLRLCMYVCMHMPLYLCVMGWHISSICNRPETKTSAGLFCFKGTYGHV